MCIREVEIKGSGRIQYLRSQIFRGRCGRTHRLRECERCDIEGPKVLITLIFYRNTIEKWKQNSRIQELVELKNA